MTLAADKEARRLEALRDADLLDTLPEQVYDRVVSLAAEVCQTPIALFSLVDENRQWFKAAKGLDVRETSRDVSFCQHAVSSDQLLIVEDATRDQRFVDNALVLESPNIRFYCGMPVHAPSGHALGTICVIDRQPRRLSDQQLKILRELARALEAHIDLRRANREVERLLLQRESLSSMLAHDANNLMQLMFGELETIERTKGLDGPAHRLEESLQSLRRMFRDFVEVNASDTATFQPTISRWTAVDLTHWLQQFVERESSRAVGLKRRLVAKLDIRRPVAIDESWLERILLNLLENACRCSPSGSEVGVSVEAHAGQPVRITVEDEGPGVPQADRERIFEPHFSVRRPGEPRGKGLGLAFCHKAVHALGGRIWVEDRQPTGASFRIEIPQLQPT